MIPRIQLTELPTPVQELPRLSKKLGGPTLAIKRDDLTGLALGGNKTRKLEYLLADAQGQQADILLTTGAAQSNHCRQTAAAASRCGFKCKLVLAGDPPAEYSGNLTLDFLLGADIVWTGQEDRDTVLEREFQRAGNQGHTPYLIPYGGSNSTGAFAYYQAVRELERQAGNNFPDWIVFATSSGGTQAGLVAGAAAWDLDLKVLGISVDERADVMQSKVTALANQVLEKARMSGVINEKDILVDDEYLGAGYGNPGIKEVEAIRLFAREEGLILDPVYTGRAAGGLIDLIDQGYFEKNERVLFWHTGGTPAVFADRYRGVLLGG